MIPSDKTRILGPASIADSSQSPYITSHANCNPEAGLKLGNLRLVRQIGSGGMGTVFEAHHESLQRSFAVKFLNPTLANDLKLRDRFQQEILALGKLNHPNIVQPIDAGNWNGRPYLVTELLRGRDLDSIVSSQGSLSMVDACSYVAQAATGLRFAHQHGFVHRDIKPSNLFLCDDGSLKLIDFGLVRVQSEESELTQVGQFIGSVDYLSPEQASAPQNADYLSDIYSLGCTWIYLLSGTAPYPDSHYPSVVAKLKGHMMETSRWLELPHSSIHPEILDTIKSMVAKRPCDRPNSFDEIIDRIQKHQDLGQSPGGSCPSLTSLPIEPTSNSSWKMSLLGVALLLVVTISIGRLSYTGRTSLEPLELSKSASPSNELQMENGTTSKQRPKSSEKKRESLSGGRVRSAGVVTLPISKSSLDGNSSTSSAKDN